MQAAREDKRISLIRQSKKEENAIESIVRKISTHHIARRSSGTDDSPLDDE